MAIDLKYGKVTLEHGDIGETEPIVVFRATDRLVPKLLAYYHLFCLREGSPKRHLDLILESRAIFVKWQERNSLEIRTPSSEASKEWMDH